MGWEVGKNHEEQKTGCSVSPSPEDASTSKGNKEASRRLLGLGVLNTRRKREQSF